MGSSVMGRIWGKNGGALFTTDQSGNMSANGGSTYTSMLPERWFRAMVHPKHVPNSATRDPHFRQAHPSFATKPDDFQREA